KSKYQSGFSLEFKLQSTLNSGISNNSGAALNWICAGPFRLETESWEKSFAEESTMMGKAKTATSQATQLREIITSESCFFIFYFRIRQCNAKYFEKSI